MPPPAIPDVITVVGSAYFQPISDLVENLLKRPKPDQYPAGTSHRENGYSASLIVLLVAVLESYTARLKFLRNAETPASKGTPELLAELFPDIPTSEELVEVFLLRNLVVHNHVWHLDVSDGEDKGAPTLTTPQQLGFQVNKHYSSVVDLPTRRTLKLGLNASPTAVDRGDVQKVFSVIWSTLAFMNAKDYSQTPLAGRTIRFRNANRQFEDLLSELGAGATVNDAL